MSDLIVVARYADLEVTTNPTVTVHGDMMLDCRGVDPITGTFCTLAVILKPDQVVTLLEACETFLDTVSEANHATT